MDASQLSLLTDELLWTLAGLLTTLACVPLCLYASGRLKPRGHAPEPERAPEAAEHESFPYSLAILARVLEAEKMPHATASTPAEERG
ncbi:MAG: hypothetical protein HY858_10415 [Candidatus Solibacter usitatus]|nr:hypothetical protein [Candidatus Solibacter usitatus]